MTGNHFAHFQQWHCGSVGEVSRTTKGDSEPMVTHPKKGQQQMQMKFERITSNYFLPQCQRA